MVKNWIFLFLIFISYVSYSQGEANNWYFGFGADAIYSSGSLTVSPIGAGFDAALGHIAILVGKNTGLTMPIKVGSMGIIVPGAGVSANLTKIYYSGNLSDFDKTSFNAFYGKGIEGFVGYGEFGVTGSLSLSHTFSTYKNFTIGVGLSIGIGTPGVGGGIIKNETKKW